MSYSAKVILDSVSPAGHRLTTLEVCFPRFILSELNTHRVFSRNSASSRAVPIAKMIDRAKTDPVFPIEWGKNQSGMQAQSLLDSHNADLAYMHWREARDEAIYRAQMLSEVGVHKQIVNRILEPFLWHTAIISSTEWDNFFDQRLDKAAQPEMRHTAELMKAAIDDSVPKELPYGAWHAPYLKDFDCSYNSTEWCLKQAIARCARVSYLNHDGVHDPEADLRLFEKLVAGKHLSPFEHVARPSDHSGKYDLYMPDAPNDEANFRGWRQARWNVEKGLGLAE